MVVTERTPATSPTLFARTLLGFDPHPGQVEFLECRAPITVACCGRRWGKTSSVAAKLLWFAMAHPGTTQLVIAPTDDQARISFDMAVTMAQQGALAALISRLTQSPFPELTLAAGHDHGSLTESRIMVRSASNGAKYTRGHGADRLIVDEAAFVGAQVLPAVMPMLADSPYHELELVSSPFGLNHFYEYFQRGKRGDSDVVSFQFPSHGNPHLDRAYLERQRTDLTEMRYRVEYLAEFVEDQASVFRWSDIQAAVDPESEQDQPIPGHRYVIGFDPAKYHDRSGLVVLDVTAQPQRSALTARGVSPAPMHHQES